MHPLLLKGLETEHEEMMEAKQELEQKQYQETISNIIRKREKARSKSTDNKE
jgi:hypothetical protein